MGKMNVIMRLCVPPVAEVRRDVWRNLPWLAGLLIATTCYVLASSLLIRVFEDQWSFLHACYFTVINMTTVGFGDVVPLTHGGKVIAGLNAFAGLLFFGIFVAVLALALQAAGGACPQSMMEKEQIIHCEDSVIEKKSIRDEFTEFRNSEVDSAKKLSEIAQKNILLALESFFAPFRYAHWRHLNRKAAKDSGAEWSTEIPAPLALELYTAATLDWPNIFFDPIKGADDRLCPALVAYDIFWYPWLYKFNSIHPDNRLKVLDLFRACTGWADETLTKTVANYGAFISTPLLAAVADFTTDGQYYHLINIPDGLSWPLYATSSERGISLENLKRKGVIVRDLARHG